MDNNIIQLGEGHYKDDRAEYMSIYIYKKSEGFSDYLNYDKINGAEALEFKDDCNKKFISEFTLSSRYDHGYVYDLECLKKYYKGKPKRLKFTIKGKNE